MAISVVAALGGFLFGFDSAIVNGTVSAIRDQYHLRPGMLGFTVAVALLGAALGAWVAGFSANRFGRVRTMVAGAFLLTISAIGSGLAFFVADLIFWRFIGGAGIGFASVVAPAYISEISPAQYRGRLATMHQMMVVIGVFLALLTSALLAVLAGGAAHPLWLGLSAWRWMFLSATLPALAYGLFALRLPESPRYLVARGRLDEAAAVLKRIVHLDTDEATASKIAAIQQTVDIEHRQRLSDLCGGRFGLLPLVWVGIGLSVFEQCVGINAIFYYSTALWQSVGFKESDSFLISVITAIVNILATVIAVLLIDKVGRRALLLAGAVVMTVSLALMTLAFAQISAVDGITALPYSWRIVALIGTNVFVIGFGASWGPVVWVLLGEMFPNRIRALAAGMGAAAQWIANFVVSITFPMLASWGLKYAYGLYSISALLALIFVVKAVPETNGKQLESMDELAAELG